MTSPLFTLSKNTLTPRYKITYIGFCHYRANGRHVKRKDFSCIASRLRGPLYMYGPSDRTRRARGEERYFAMNETILTWNFTNWVTVIIMAAVGFTLLGFAVKVYQKRQGA
jgi:hypothetical protein